MLANGVWLTPLGLGFLVFSFFCNIGRFKRVSSSCCMFDDPYAILGLDPRASLEEIKKAYRLQIRLHHPDRHPGPEAEKRCEQITAAYQQLSQARGEEPTLGKWDVKLSSGKGYTVDRSFLDAISDAEEKVLDEEQTPA